jgi:hypothetical protein
VKNRDIGYSVKGDHFEDGEKKGSHRTKIIKT